MPEEERLSAVAKRRRLNGIALRGSESVTTSRSQSPAKLLILKEGPSLDGDDNVPDTDSKIQSSNEFDALVTQDFVQFSNFREVEKLNDQAIKIRLSKEQQCFISGRYSLWIKQGTIDFLGARLESSSDVHNVYSSRLLEIPAILALSDSVEVEIRSHRDEVPAFLALAPFQWSSPTNDLFSVSFFVHGYSIALSGNGPTLSKGCDTRFAKEFSQRVCGAMPVADSPSTPTVVACGRQFIGTTAPFTCILNGLITARGRTRKPLFSQGLLLLDLDTNMPIMTPPGTSSLVHIAKPILGPSFTQAATFHSVDSADPFTVIRIQYECKASSAERCVTQLAQYLEHVKDFTLQRSQNYPLVIRANSWLEYFDSGNIETLTKKISPNFVVCHGLESASYSGQLGSMIAHQSNASPVSIMPVISSKGPLTSSYNELMLQSYFHFGGYTHGCSRWSCLPVELDVNRKVLVTYGRQSDLVSAMSVWGIPFGRVDTEDMLDGCAVAMILHESKITSEHSNLGSQSLKHHAKPADEAQVNEHSKSVCLGFGIFAGFARNGRGVYLSTPIEQNALDDYAARGEIVELVFPKADPDSGFDTAWVKLELGAPSTGTRSGKTIYRRKLNV